MLSRPFRIRRRAPGGHCCGGEIRGDRVLSLCAISSIASSSAKHPCGHPGARIGDDGPVFMIDVAFLDPEVGASINRSRRGRRFLIAAPIPPLPCWIKSIAVSLPAWSAAILTFCDRVGPITGRECSSLRDSINLTGAPARLGESACEDHLATGAEFRAEATAKKFGYHANVVARQLELNRQIVAHREDALGRHPHCQLVTVPARDAAVRFRAIHGSAPAWCRSPRGRRGARQCPCNIADVRRRGLGEVGSVPNTAGAPEAIATSRSTTNGTACTQL